MNTTVKIAVAAVLWTTVLGLAVVGTIGLDRRLMFWSILSALVACMVTVHIIAECAVRRERIRIEQLGEAVAAKAIECIQTGGSVTQIR